MSMEKTAVTEGFSKSKRGQIFGFIIGLSTMAVAAFLAYLGHAALAKDVVLYGMGILAVVFVIGKVKLSRSLTKKAQ